MATKTQLETSWHTPDELSALIAPILGKEKAAGTVGRTPRPSRAIFDAIVYVLRTGCQWPVCRARHRQALPREAYAPGSTVHDRLTQWVQTGAFHKAWQILLS